MSGIYLQNCENKDNILKCMALFLTSLFLAALKTSAVKYDFEGESTFPWNTDEDKPFHRVEARHFMFTPGRPLTDTSLGTDQGHYVYAEYDERLISDFHDRTLYHNCQSPSGPRCRLNFNAIIHSPDDLYVATRPRCDSCAGNVSASNQKWEIVKVKSTQPKGGWTKQSVLLGSHPVTFDIEFFAMVPEKNNFVALDDLELVDCEPELPEEIICPEDDSFRCDGLQECLSRDQVCDLQHDCLCGEDESMCDIFQSHPEGYLRLDGCDFDSMECLWYNVYQDNRQSGSLVWRVQNSTEPSQLYHHKKTGSPPPPPGKYLHVQTSQYFPGDVAILRSATFQHLFARNSSCQARFWYRNSAKGALLQLQLIEITGKSMPRSARTVWKILGTDNEINTVYNGTNQESDDPEDESNLDLGVWTRVVVDLNSAPINLSYILQFTVTSYNSSSSLLGGEVAVHSLSLSPECFHAAISLTPCDADGAQGPTQEKCDRYYGHQGLVRVLEHGRFAGVQSWTIPATMTYRIQAAGARGGLGASDSQILPGTQGTSLTAKFDLTKGEVIYFLVGQPGEDVCQATEGRVLDTVSTLPALSNNISHRNGGGGGGGGGATIVFKMTNEKTVHVLMVAGGGAGHPRHSYYWFDKTTKSSDNSKASDGLPTLSDTGLKLLIEGSLEGSSPCLDSTNKDMSCHGRGGFGAGGGACIGGGDGGGVDRTLFQRLVGLPGRSYIHNSALYHSMLADSHFGPGFVEIFSEMDCGCDGDYLCLWLDNQFSSTTCLCPNGSCTARVKVTEDETPDHMFLIVVAASLLATFFSIVCICLYLQRHTLRTRQPTNVKKLASFLCPCIDLSRRAMSLSAHVLPQIQRPPAIMHVNPNYDVVPTKCPEQGLEELPRKHLKLTSALGQGAFGEVYYGLLSNVPMVDGDLPVAVKTLPPVCTDQTELDFLMEAVIVSKFNHPNIVKFMGVCFEQHPHYLVLELLEGGDLKSFLRQARPKWDQPSSLTVLDLLRLCLDISRGCQHLEEKHFIHRDIAARNCLLTTKGPNRTAKIADFGMARDIYRSDYYKKAGKAMLPVKWMPPEAFLDGVFTTKTDVWSFGILMWEVFSLGHMPYPGCSNEEVMNLVTQGGRLDPPESCPSPVFDIMVSCWSALPEGRPNFSLIIASLERALQDDDMVSRGLPVFYVPPIINTRGLRLQQNQTTSSTRPKVATSRGLTSTGTAFSPNISGDGYLEPLLTQNSRSQSHDLQYRSSPYNYDSRNESKPTSHSLTDCISGRVFFDNGKGASKPVCRTPRVFYKPGSSHHSPVSAASEALLPTQNSFSAYNTAQKDEEALSGEQKYELCMNVNGSDASKDGCHLGEPDMDSEDCKHNQAVNTKTKNKRKSYTNFPKPPT